MQPMRYLLGPSLEYIYIFFFWWGGNPTAKWSGATEKFNVFEFFWKNTKCGQTNFSMNKNIVIALKLRVSALSE